MPPSPAPARDLFWPRIARVAALSVVLGLVLEGLLLAVRSSAGSTTGWSVIAAESVQKVSWSALLCLALASVQSLQKIVPGVLAWAGLIAAPTALLLARALHKAAAQALSASLPASTESVLVPAALKALEYVLFGILVARLDARGEARLGPYLRTGAALGALFGLVVLAIKQPGWVPGMALFVNEFCFPIACAFVLFVSAQAVRRVSSAPAPKT